MYQPRAFENVVVPPDFVTLREAAAMCSVSQRILTGWSQAGKLIAVVTPEGRCFRRSAIEAAAALVGDDDYPLD